MRVPFAVDVPTAALRRIAARLGPGAVIVFPTDTLYGLGGRALDGDAARRVFALKGRDEGKPLPLVAADEAQAAALAAGWSGLAPALARRFWPGPLTLVVPARKGLPAGVASDAGGVAVRVPAHRGLRQLCARVGPLVATSANFTGVAPARRLDEVPDAITAAAAATLEGGPLGDGPASTVVDLCGAEPLLIREGAVAWARLRAAFP